MKNGTLRTPLIEQIKWAGVSTVLNQTLGRNRKQLRVCVVAIDTGGTG